MITYVFLPADLINADSYDKIVDVVSEKTKDAGLNILFNNAGVSSKFTRLGLVKKKQLTDAFLINTIVPIMLTKVCLLLHCRRFALNERTNLMSSDEYSRFELTMLFAVIVSQGSATAIEDGCEKRRGYDGTEREESGGHQYDFCSRQHRRKLRRRLLSLQMQQSKTRRRINLVRSIYSVLSGRINGAFASKCRVLKDSSLKISLQLIY